MTDISKEVTTALEQEPDTTFFEKITEEQSSPLNQAVKENDIAGRVAVEKEMGDTDSTEPKSSQEDEENHTPPQSVSGEEEPLDAPEQIIDENYDEQKEQMEEVEGQSPAHAKMVADAILGSANNLIAVGGGYFVRIKKHKDFYDFDEIIQVIDEQNQKNVERIKLDEEDKALLKPLLVQVIQRQSKKLSPEQQLLGALISIIVKKGQVVMQVKAENELLTQRILDIIQESNGSPEQHQPDESQKETVEFNNTTETVTAEHEETMAEAVLEPSFKDEPILTEA